MPSPLAHSITGYAIFKIFRLKNPPQLRFSRPVLVWSIIAANVADVDFIPQLLTDANIHRGITHSIALTVVVSLVAFVLSYRIARHLATQVFFLTAAIYGSHLLLDFFTAGGRGMQLLWPLTPMFFQSPFPLFPAVHHSEGIFYWGHLLFIGYELVYAFLLMKGFDFFTSERMKSQNPIELDS